MPDFGELSKKLAEVWKQLPEKDKLVSRLTTDTFSLLCPPACVILLCCCCCSVVQACLTLASHGLYPTRLFWPWDFPGRNTGVGCHSLLQGIFLTPDSNSCLQHWQADSFTSEPLGKPEIPNTENREKKKNYRLVENGLEGSEQVGASSL